ncbi:MAG: hypothetical protein IT567_06455 [Alphaproteobacteria bacterium]|nr:hypothetical protein [Alphaproteobacteria bacterium]
MITDITPYRKYVDQFDLTEQQKIELVNAVWTTLENYFDQQLGINQLPLKERALRNTNAELEPEL